MLKCIKLIVLITILFSCTEYAPEIRQLFWQVNKFYDIEKDSVYETLSFFVHAYDEDGIDDIRSLYIINDSRELYWKLESDDWVLRAVNDEHWIGTNSIIMNDYSAIPSGNYRVIIIDDGGKRDQQAFYISPGKADPDKSIFPSAAAVNKSAVISGTPDVIWFYDRNNSLVAEKSGEELADRRIEIPEKTVKMFLYRYDRKNGFGLFSGPFLHEN